jgi:hypothetical protein
MLRAEAKPRHREARLLGHPAAALARGPTRSALLALISGHLAHISRPSAIARSISALPPDVPRCDEVPLRQSGNAHGVSC